MTIHLIVPKVDYFALLVRKFLLGNILIIISI